MIGSNDEALYYATLSREDWRKILNPTPQELVESSIGKVWTPSDKRPFTLEQFRNRLTCPKLSNKLSPSQPRQEMSQL